MKILELSHLTKKLELEEDWCQVLSLGEQQRISFLKIFVQKPKWIFLDESLASININMGNKILCTLKKELPKKSSIIMISHSTEYNSLFDKQITLQKQKS